MTIFTYIQTEIKEIRDQLERDEVKRAIKKACKRARERAIRELAAEARREAINKIKNEIKAEMAAKAQQEQAHTQSLADSMVLLTCTSCGASISDPVTQLCETCNSNQTDSTDSEETLYFNCHEFGRDIDGLNVALCYYCDCRLTGVDLDDGFDD